MVDLNYLALKISSVLGDDAAADVVEKVATKTTYIATAATIFSGMSSETVLAWVTGTTAILTAAFNAWFKMTYLRPDKRGKHKISERRKKPRGGPDE